MGLLNHSCWLDGSIFGFDDCFLSLKHVRDRIKEYEDFDLQDEEGSSVAIAELQEKCLVWCVDTSPKSKYHVFLSYRWGGVQKPDESLVQAAYDTLILHSTYLTHDQVKLHFKQFHPLEIANVCCLSRSMCF